MKILNYFAKAVHGCPDLQGSPFLALHSVMSNFLDRTGTIPLPFPHEILYKLPTAPSNSTLDEVCSARARELLNKNCPIYLFYSGGLDSTTAMLAFFEEAKPDERARVTVVATADSIAENPNLWPTIVRNFPVMHYSAVKFSALSGACYVYSECADQLFGSDKIFKNDESPTAPYTEAWLEHLAAKSPQPSYVAEALARLASKCPLPVNTISEFYWWLNFTVKWQAVACRSIMLSGLPSIPTWSLENFTTFFNTEAFQQLALQPEFARWGKRPSPTTYKQALRDYILARTQDKVYVETKHKLGSLYQAVRDFPVATVALAVDGDTIRTLTAEQFNHFIKETNHDIAG